MKRYTFVTKNIKRNIMKRYTVVSIVIMMLFFCVATETRAAQVNVIRALDGDTFKVLIDDIPFIVRLYGVDAPEKRQLYGKVAWDFSKQIEGEEVTLIYVKTGAYGRIVGKIEYNGQDWGLILLKYGLAWHDPKHAKNEPVYIEAQEKVIKNRIGIWSLNDFFPPLSPWDFRKEN